LEDVDTGPVADRRRRRVAGDACDRPSRLAVRPRRADDDVLGELRLEVFDGARSASRSAFFSAAGPAASAMSIKPVCPIGLIGFFAAARLSNSSLTREIDRAASSSFVVTRSPVLGSSRTSRVVPLPDSAP